MPLIIEDLGVIDYATCYKLMYDYTVNRGITTPDKLLLLEHPSVFTLGLAGDPSHIINSQHDIPVVKTDRGGQVTYHGVGQLIIYPLVDLSRLGISIRQLVEKSENVVINLLASYGILAISKREAPGVYVDGKKIASLGYKIKSHRCYHGISINVTMDMLPFSYINPCGYAGMQMAKIADYVNDVSVEEVKHKIIEIFIKEFYPS